MTTPFLRHAPLALMLAVLPGLGLAQDQQPPAQAPAQTAEPAPAQAPKPGITVAHGIATFGEPELPADFKHLRYVNPDAPKGGEISQSGIGGFDSYNPFTHRGRANFLSVIMLERLMEGTADETDSAYCLLCETIEYPESRDWVIFTLRPDVTFSDGTPVTAQDVLFTYDTLRTKGLNSFRTILAQSIKGAEVLDDHRIRFDFVKDYPRRDVIQGAGGLPVFSKKDFEDNNRDLEASGAKPFIGSGPYMFDRADMGRTIVWKRNPD